MLLIREGDWQPTMTRIARRAGVSERTLFRHYDLRLHVAAIDQALDILRGRVLRPFRGTTVAARMADLMERRARTYEHVHPLLAARSLVAGREAELASINAQLVEHERQRLALALGPDLPPGSPLFEALAMAVSFLTWERLRFHQGLPPEAAAAAVSMIVGHLLSGAAATD